jgi:acyl dehydratase
MEGQRNIPDSIIELTTVLVNTFAEDSSISAKEQKNPPGVGLTEGMMAWTRTYHGDRNPIASDALP